MITINDVIAFLNSAELSDYLLPFKIAAVLFTALFLYGIWYYTKEQQGVIADAKRRLHDFLSFQKSGPDKTFLNRSKQISSLLEKGEHKKAVLKTESLFFDLLIRLGYTGYDLKQIADTPSVPNQENLKRLAEIAEELKKNPTYAIDIEELKTLYDSYEDTLRKMGVLADGDEKK